MVDFTTVVGVDAEHAEEWRITWPTWKANRPQLLTRPLLVVCDANFSEREWRDRLGFIDHPNVSFRNWDMPRASQREKMLNGLVFAVRDVATEWYLKLDVDVIAEPCEYWLDERWFTPNEQGALPAFVASPWFYTKPASWIGELDLWAENADVGAANALSPRGRVSNGKFHHRRIISYCFFGNSAWTRRMGEFCQDGRLPVPSHDTFLWYCAARRGDFFRTVRMAERKWRHLPKRKLAAAARTALSSGTSGLVAPEHSTTDHARELIRLGAALRRPNHVLRAAEIGVAYGRTSESLLRQLTDLHLTLVDNWTTYAETHGYRKSGDSCALLTQDAQDERYRLTRERTEFAAPRRTISRCDSVTAAERIDNASLDFAFIDADHTYEAVKRDIVAWWPKIRGGGILAGHDYHARRDLKGHWGVARAVTEFAESSGLNVQVLPGHVWTIRKPTSVRTAFVKELPGADHSSSERGVVYLLTGPAHATRLVASVASLRRFWAGQITVYTTHTVSDEVGRLLAIDLRLNVEHRTWQLYPSRRNASFLTKVAMLPHTPYQKSVYLDCDTVVCGNIEPLFAALDQHPFCATQFANWTTTKNVLKRRIDAWRTLHSRRLPKSRRDQLIEGALRPYPAVNGGVFAFRRDASIIGEWLGLAVAGRRTFICDEIALQLLLPEHEHSVLDCRFNCSPTFARRTCDVRIWHFHGEKHLCSTNARSLWLPEFERTVHANYAGVAAWGTVLDPTLNAGQTREQTAPVDAFGKYYVSATS